MNINTFVFSHRTIDRPTDQPHGKESLLRS